MRRLLKGIFESDLPLDDLPSSIDALVCPVELERQQQGDEDDESVRNHAGHDTRSVLWLIDLPEHRGTNDTSDTAESNKRSRAQRTLPLPTDVVGLVSHDSGDVGVRAYSREEDTKVSRAVVGAEAEDGKANEAEAGVDDDGAAAVAELIGEDGLNVHEESCGGVGRGDEALCLGDIEAHAEHEDDGEEVGDGVGGGGAEAEEGGEAPDLEITGVAKVLAQVERGSDCVGAVLFDARDHEVDLFVVEEAAGALGLIGEVDEEEVADEAEDAGEDAFHLKRVSWGAEMGEGLRLR